MYKRQDVYEPLASQQVDVTAEKDKTVEAVFETKQKEEVIPAGHGEVNIRLQIDEYDNDYMGPGGSYIIKDKNGNVLENCLLYTSLHSDITLFKFSLLPVSTKIALFPFDTI